MNSRSPDPVDDLLVMQAQDGDRRSMDELVRRWQRRLWAHAYRLTGRTDAAWDVTQQAWVAIVKGLRKLHDPASFRAWAYRIVANKAADHVKSRPPDDGVGEAAEQRPADQEGGAILRELMGRLAPEKRHILVLYYVEGLTIPELAFVLRVPDGTVKSRLYAAREEFKRLWAARSGEAGDEG